MEHEGTVAAVADRVTDDELAARVALGANLLDQKIPGWWREDYRSAIYLPRLALWSAAWCVLGMLGGYWHWANELGLSGVDDEGDPQTAPYGFALSTSEAAFDDTAYDRLTIEWRALIAGRRLEAAA